VPQEDKYRHSVILHNLVVKSLWLFTYIYM